MAERPLLPLPRPEAVPPPMVHGGGRKPSLPGRDQQVARFDPIFQRLRRVVDSVEQGVAEPLALRDDPTSLAPERVVVFEIAGTVADFRRALSRVHGFELMAEYDTEEPADDLFAQRDSEGRIRTDKMVAGRFYLAMPDMAALRQLISLWERHVRGESLGRGFTPFRHVFDQMRRLRPWGPEDRIPDDTIQYWREEVARAPERPVRTEVEFWFYSSAERRNRASQTIAALVSGAEGTVLHEAMIPEIAYHGALIEIPVAQLSALIERQEVSLAVADEVMFLRPQSLLVAPLQPEAAGDAALEARRGAPTLAEPIAALFDGVPLQGHVLLADRVIVDDPDDLQARALVAHRIHGTAMASLILHGDLNAGEDPVDRPLYIRPVIFASEPGPEGTDGTRLLVDTIYRAVLRMKGTSTEAGSAPSVFLVNLSLGDLRRPFTRMVSPLARLLDFLSEQHGILFLVSAGNVTHQLTLREFATWTDFKGADAVSRERAVLTALNDAKHERSMLSPAESVNALTVGAHHSDEVGSRETPHIAVDPFEDHELPNPSSALGLGYRRAIKPEIFMPGGREHVWMGSTGDSVTIRFGRPQRLYGLRAATTDPSGHGRLDQAALSDGTSSATALATRAAHRMFAALMDGDGGSPFTDMPREFYALAIKALFVHRARWNAKGALLKEICGPADKRRHVERCDNVSRFLGFGIPNVLEALECATNRATLLGFDKLQPNHSHRYYVPLPGSLEGVTEPRSLTVTLTWFSPIRPGYHGYRCVKLEAAPRSPQHRPRRRSGRASAR